MNNFHFEMKYKLLSPIEDEKDYLLSIGTIEMLIPEEIRFDFSKTLGSAYPMSDGSIVIEAKVCGIDPEVFAEDYERLKLDVTEIDKDFFKAREQYLRVLEVYTEFYHHETENCIPLDLLSMLLVFHDDSKIDLTKRITDQCRELLKGCAA